MKGTTTNSKEISSMLSSLAEDIVNLMLREHQSIHQELEHVGRLINEASTTLTASFDELNKITEKQNAILDPTSQKEIANDIKSSVNCTILDDRVKQNQQNIITALQFDDIVQQLTKHSQSRTKQIQLMFKKLANSLEDMKKYNYEHNPELTSRVLELKHDVNNLRKELEKENPVKQSSLAIGKIELF